MPVTSTWMTQTYAGNASTQTFAYGQPIQSIYDLSVYLTDNTGYKYAPLVSEVDYQVNGVGNSNSSTWNITYPLASGVAALPTGWTLTINLDVPLVTNTNITTITTSSGSTIQGAFDRATLQALSLEQQIQNVSSTVVSGVSSVNGNTGAVTITAAGLNAAPINSPTLTGTPAAPTASAATNTTQIATTAFTTGAVNAAVSGTSTYVAYFTGNNTVGGQAGFTYSASPSSPALTVTGSSVPQFNVNSTGGSNFQLISAAANSNFGTTTSTYFAVITNSATRAIYGANGVYNFQPVALTDASPTSWDCSKGNYFTWTPGASETINASNVVAGADYDLVIKTAGTTSYTLTFGTNIKSNTLGTPSTLATGTTANKYFFIKYKGTPDGLVEVSRTS